MIAVGVRLPESALPLGMSSGCSSQIIDGQRQESGGASVGGREVHARRLRAEVVRSFPPRFPVSVTVETFTRELVITEPEEVGQYRDIHAVLTGHALDEAASRDHLRELAASL